MTEAACVLEKKANIYQAKPYHIEEDNILHSYRHENLKSETTAMFLYIQSSVFLL
jgi:hypothetical protein